ncbi:hypothetical protein ACVPOS_17275 [Staphylococcus aureus]
MKQQLIQQIILLSNKEFTRYQYKYIDNRFNNRIWEIGYPHVNLKIKNFSSIIHITTFVPSF